MNDVYVVVGLFFSSTVPYACLLLDEIELCVCVCVYMNIIHLSQDSE